MKNLNYLNYFFVGTPILLILTGTLFAKSLGAFIGFGLLFLILTGVFQIITGISLLLDQPKDKLLQVYISLVVLFFLIFTFNLNILKSDILYFILIPVPPILAIYFSVLIYTKQQS